MTLRAHEVRVSTFSLQMRLQGTSSNFNLFASSARYLLLRASLAMISLLQDFEWWATTAVGTLDDSELALLENMRGVVLVGDRFALASIVTATESSTVKHGLFNWMQLVNHLDGLMAVFTVCLFGVRLARTANQLVALFAIAGVNGAEATVSAK